MTFAEAKTLFKDKYTSVGLTLSEEQADKLVFSRGESKWIVDAADLNGYIEQESKFAKFAAKPTGTSICSQSYCEQALIDVDVSPFSSLREGDIVFGKEDAGGPVAVFGRASGLFQSYFRFNPEFLEWNTRRLRDTPIARRRNDVRIVDKMVDFPVIKVAKIEAASTEEAAKIANGIISGCLFQLAAVRGICHRARRKWPKLRLASQSQPQQDEAESPLPFLKVNPIRDLVSLYTLGAGTHYPQFQFLAYYQVLEYFFIKIADERLYGKLTRRINDLAFRCVPDQLDRIIQDVTEHRRETDEVEMLKDVLEKYVDETELLGFLAEFEEKSGVKQYFKKRTLFGTDVQISTTSGHVFGSVAKTIKTVRNALVHSSDRHERAQRYVPFSEDEALITAEIPLMRFLAEKVIIATAAPLA